MSDVKRHPVRGFFAGLLVGLGVALLGIVTSQIALGTIPPYLCIVVGIVLGVLWAMFGPARTQRIEGAGDRRRPSDGRFVDDGIEQRIRHRNEQRRRRRRSVGGRIAVSISGTAEHEARPRTMPLRERRSPCEVS